MDWLMPELVPDFIKKLCNKRGDPTIPLLQDQFCSYLDDKKIGYDKWMKKFDRLKTNTERVNTIYEILKTSKMLEERFVKDEKSDDKAIECKNKGNKCFGSENFPKAFRYYTKMLMNAKTQELKAIAYANRSAVLFKLKLFEACINNVDKALANNYPEKLKGKLIARKAKSVEYVRKSRKTYKYYEEPPKIPTNRKNPAINCASNCLEVKTDHKSRRRVFAARDITLGEVIAVEAPFAAFIDEARLYHCHDCFELCYTTIPCDNCTQTIYCSENCKQNAYNRYHKDECPILLSVKRLVGKHKFFLLGIKMAFLNKDENADEVLKLTSNLYTADNPMMSDRFTESMTAGFLYDLVKKHTQRFEGPNSEHMEKVFKDTLVDYLRLCNVQTTGIDELCPNKQDEDDMPEQETVATAIYPFYALFRHACCPNVFAQHHGTNKVLRAIRSIKKGEECFVSFGPHYPEQDKEERQDRLLAQFHFTCKCRACKENWPQVSKRMTAISTQEDLLFICQVSNNDVELCKRTVPRKIRKMKEMEAMEPNSDLSYQQKLLLRCYDIFGNKRQFL